ncbi:DUF2572 family protein [Clostridium folliculivorans]|uniref:DUF2572 family protein n=1 Tax=Clostridium folliculivorans TaxID=2886038 RepID=UPI0021C4C647|nr:DUF2572 family protein [Clostridium folliculivorans]GKU32018.1 hypothetical protein CFB3_41260 [Clostridium folliculivorans]
MRKKKKGSTLITVVAIFAVLFTVGTSVLALTASSYQSRVLESRRVENLYGSESGIDVAYAITGKVVEQAVRRGNYSVKTFMDTFTNVLASEKNKMKTGQACDYPRDDDATKSKLLNDDYTTNLDKVKTLLNDMFKATYRNVIHTYLHDKIVSKSFLTMADDSTGTPTSTPATFNTSYEPTFDVDVYSRDGANHDVGYDTASKFTVKIVSDYQVDSSTGNQERKVEANYTINVPDYAGVYGTKTTKGKIELTPVIQKAIAIDGDLRIKGDLTVSGGCVFVKGNDPSENDMALDTYSKYNGGIIIDNTSNITVDFKEDVVTSNTLKLLNNASVTLDKKLYANNIYVGKNTTADSSSGNTLTVTGESIIDNDLAYNSNNSHIKLPGGLYAISELNRTHTSSTSAATTGATDVSDGSLNSGTTSSDTTTENLNEHFKSSSSIIVNTSVSGADSDDTVANRIIDIGNEALIMGTAYINTSPEAYQTGESVAVKGNYKAYTTMFSPDEDGYGYYYKYFEPLQLLERVDKDGKSNISAFEKADHFIMYNQKSTDKLRVPKNISLPDNTYSAGAYISRGTVYASNYDMATFENEAEKWRKDYATEVYEMGNRLSIDDKDLPKKYNNGNVEKKVSNQINFKNSTDNITHNYNHVNTDANMPDKIIINLDKDKSNETVVFVGDGTSYTPSANEKVIRGSAVNGLIITTADIKIYGSVIFKGALISTGSMEIEQGATVTLNYDPNYILDVLKGYSDYFGGVFITGSGNVTSTPIYEYNQAVASTSDVVNAIDPKKYIQKGVWKINQ